MYISCCLSRFFLRWVPNANAVLSGIWAIVLTREYSFVYPPAVRFFYIVYIPKVARCIEQIKARISNHFTGVVIEQLIESAYSINTSSDSRSTATIKLVAPLLKIFQRSVGASSLAMGSRHAPQRMSPLRENNLPLLPVHPPPRHHISRF